MQWASRTAATSFKERLITRWDSCDTSSAQRFATTSQFTLEDHLLKVQQVLRALRDAGFSGNPDRCLFAQKKTEFLGHVISAAGMEMQPEKFNAMLRYKRPESNGALRGFLGLAGYYRTFVQNFGTIAAPLTSLLAGSSGSGKVRKLAEKELWPKGAWTDKHDRAFRALKGALLSAPILSAPVAGRRYLLATDASNHSFGAVLSQWDEQGKERPIAYMSKKLTGSQQRWLIWEKELAAAVWATAVCRPYLIGQSFDLITDNKVIEALLKKDLPTKRQNWVMRLSEFNYNIIHRKASRTGTPTFSAACELVARRRAFTKKSSTSTCVSSALGLNKTSWTKLQSRNQRGRPRWSRKMV